MVTRSALQNAASIAKNILVTEAIVAEAPEKAGRRWRRWHARWRHARHDVGSSAPYDRSAGPRLRTRPRRRFPEPPGRAARSHGMKPPLRILTCALASASILAAVPAGANPGIQRVAGGPGASAMLKNGVLTMHWPGGSTTIKVPPDYALPAVTTRGQLGGVSHDGRTVVLAYGRKDGSGRSRFLVAEDGKLKPLAFRGQVAFDALAPRGSAIYLTRRSSPTDATRYTVLSYNRADKALNPVVTKVVFSAEGGEKPDGWSMQGQPLSRATAADGTWTFTLYKSREYPFIHALPLGQGSWAMCIELPASWNGRVGTLKLRAGADQTVDVLNAQGAVVATADIANTRLTLKTPAA